MEDQEDIISWEGQRRFLEQCGRRGMYVSSEYGDLYELVYKRVKDAYQVYGDQSFFLSNEKLRKEEIEEEADRLFYRSLRVARYKFLVENGYIDPVNKQGAGDSEV